jgi:hypothetical protein
MTERDCRENIKYFKLASEVLVNKERTFQNLKNTKNNTIVLSDSIINSLVQNDAGFVNIKTLWDNNLIAKGKSIYYSGNKSILFVLP